MKIDGFCMDEELYVELMWHPTNEKHRTRDLTNDERWIIPRLLKSLKVMEK